MSLCVLCVYVYVYVYVCVLYEFVCVCVCVCVCVVVCIVYVCSHALILTDDIDMNTLNLSGDIATTINVIGC